MDKEEGSIVWPSAIVNHLLYIYKMDPLVFREQFIPTTTDSKIAPARLTSDYNDNQYIVIYISNSTSIDPLLTIFRMQ